MDSRARDELKEGGNASRRMGPVFGEGKPLDETARSEMESLLGRDLKEVRIHDGGQAAALARRLGAEALAVGKHVLGPPGKLATGTSEGAALLAHEMTHVIQQTQPPEVAPATQLQRVLAPSSVSRWWRRPASEACPEVPDVPRPTGSELEGSVAGGGIRRARPGHTQSESVQRRSDEVQARVSERAAREMIQTKTERARGPGGAGANATAVANAVYRLMLRDLALERERG